MVKKYVYPKLDCAFDLGYLRIGGSGLANCLFVYARAIKYAHTTGATIISPTWSKLSLGTYLRHERDKRKYNNLIISTDEVSGIKKIFLFRKTNTQIIQGLKGYFEEFLDESTYINQYIVKHINPLIKDKVNQFDFKNCIAVHIRLGDYPIEHRTPLEWYHKKIVEKGINHKYLLFSDGTDKELQSLTSLPNVKRAFFGNALADIYAISKCEYIIGSDSTFSGWGAFLGQVPCVFYRKHYGRILLDESKEIVEDNTNTWLHQ